MAKGVIVAHVEHVDGGPGFITGARRNRLKLEIPDRLWTFNLNNSGVIHITRCRTAAGAPLSITPGAQTLAVWKFSCSGIRAARARKVLKAVKNAATEVLTTTQLDADVRPVAAEVRASPDLRRPTAHDPSTGAPTAWEVYFMHTIAGHDHPDEANGTTAAEIENATAEPLGSGVALGRG